MPGLNPWAIVGALLGFILWTGGVYFYGAHVGHAEEKAATADGIKRTLEKFSADVTKAAADATADALKDFNDRTAALQEAAQNLNKAKGVMDAASSKLAASLKGGACVLTPVQRHFLECMRRPGSAGCSVTAAGP